MRPVRYEVLAPEGVSESCLDAHDAASLAEPQKWGDALLAAAHPSVEHYLPLLYCMGSTDQRDAVSYPYEGFDFGSISMRAILFEEISPSA